MIPSTILKEYRCWAIHDFSNGNWVWGRGGGEGILKIYLCLCNTSNLRPTLWKPKTSVYNQKAHMQRTLAPLTSNVHVLMIFMVDGKESISLQKTPTLGSFVLENKDNTCLDFAWTPIFSYACLAWVWHDFLRNSNILCRLHITLPSALLLWLASAWLTSRFWYMHHVALAA